MSQSDSVLPTTLPLLTFCKAAFDIGPCSTYQAQRRGDVPTIKIGGLWKVPVRVALAKIAGNDPEILKAVTADFMAKLRQLEADQAA
jgi:hypothetical protein